MTHVAVPIVSADPPLAGQVAAAVAQGATLVELRVDRIGAVDAVEELLRGRRWCVDQRPVEYILTIRTAEEGGAWDGPEDERIALIERLGLLLPGYVDVELSAWRRSANLRQKIGLVAGADPGGLSPRRGRSRNRLILSWHAQREPPADLDRYLDELSAEPAAVYKAVFDARDATDALRVIAALARRRKPQQWILLAQGRAGLVTRVLARKHGAFLTFASLQPGAESAAGQPTIAELRKTYRWDALGPSSPVYAVVGWPLTETRSPCVHNAAMEAAGLDGVYVALPVAGDFAGFEAFMATVGTYPELGFRGLSVTIPHKESALRWLRASGAMISPTAQRCGAVNTLVAVSGGWLGDNTDGPGAVAVLGPKPPGQAHVLGAGGVARAIVAELLAQGWRVRVFSRHGPRAAALAHELGCAWGDWRERAGWPCDLLVNATPVGMTPAVEETPYPATAFRAGQIVFDTIYTPPRTRLLREAQAAGARVVSGAGLFLAQAELQFRLWHGCPPPPGSMAQALEAASEPSPA